MIIFHRARGFHIPRARIVDIKIARETDRKILLLLYFRIRISAGGGDATPPQPVRRSAHIAFLTPLRITYARIVVDDNFLIDRQSYELRCITNISSYRYYITSGLYIVVYNNTRRLNRRRPDNHNSIWILDEKYIDFTMMFFIFFFLCLRVKILLDGVLRSLSSHSLFLRNELHLVGTF